MMKRLLDKKNNKKVGKNLIIALTAVAVMMAAGCAGSKDDFAIHTIAENGNMVTAADLMEDKVANEAAGTILLTINPELAIQYNKDGNVILVQGNNEDGKQVLMTYDDYKGKACKEVLAELVEEIYEDGYFDTKINGKDRNIILKLEKGSKYPNEQFLAELADKIEEVVGTWNLESDAMTIGENDYMENGYISPDKMKEIVLSQLNLENAEFKYKEYELDDGVYEVEFTQDGIEYEFEINAKTGKVQEADKENNKDWAIIDTDYGPNNDGVTDYYDTDYGPNNDGVTDYNDTDYGPNNDGVTDYNDTDYDPNNDGVTDYNDTDYGPNNDGVTDYYDTDYGPNNDGITDYHVTDYHVTDYGNSNYGNSNYRNSNYD